MEAFVNAGEEPTECHFQYGTTSVTEIDLPCEQATIEGGEQGVGLTVTGLQPGTSYHYRALLKNATSEAEGTSKSAEEEFTTVPTPHTEEAKSVTATTATFYGTVAPLNAVNTEYSFDYRVGLECSGESSTIPVSAGKGSGSREVSTAVSELQPNVQYSVCLVTSNAFGSQVDPTAPPVRFTTLPAPPTVLEHSESASGVTPSEVRLEGVVNPNNQITKCEFQYGTSEASLAASAPCEPASLEGFGYQGVGVTLTGLHLGTGYYYRVVAINAAHEKTEGEIASFTTAGTAPTVSTGAVTAVGQASANVSGTVIPEGVETYYYYQYGPTTEYGQRTSPGEPGISVGAGLGALEVPAILVPLTPGVTYHYRLVAWNEDGTSYGQDETFTAEAGQSPLATTGAASGVSVNEATISGTINPNGKETSYRFEYGTSIGYGTQAFGTVLPEQGEQTVTLSLRGLEAGTTYHYRLVVSNPGGTSEGQDETFTTPPIADPLVNPATAPLIALPNIAFPTGTEPVTKPAKHKKAKKKAAKKKHPKAKKKKAGGKGRKSARRG